MKQQVQMTNAARKVRKTLLTLPGPISSSMRACNRPRIDGSSLRAMVDPEVLKAVVHVVSPRDCVRSINYVVSHDSSSCGSCLVFDQL